MQGNKIEDGILDEVVGLEGEKIAVRTWVEHGPQCSGGCGKQLEWRTKLDVRMFELFTGSVESYIARERRKAKKMLAQMGGVCSACQASGGG